VLDKDAKEEATITFKEVWTFDVRKKQWVKMEAPRRETKIVPAEKKQGGGAVDGQVVADLPIGVADVGLFYAKWEVNGVPCVTYTRLGPRSRDRTLAGKPPPRYRLEDVPIDVNRSVMAFIPDPQYFTEPGGRRRGRRRPRRSEECWGSGGGWG
jgi:hypothetical protein